MGNSRARAVYEANLPDNFRRPQTDSSLEAFIRAKYEQKKYIAKEWVQPPMPKVNWDQEIEESRKKKETKRKQTTGSAVIDLPPLAPLPKPKGSSGSSSGSTTPKPIRAAEIKKEQEKAPATATEDLLGLGEIFFLLFTG